MKTSFADIRQEILGVGNDKEKLYGIVEQCMPYIGYPRSLNAMNIIDEVSMAREDR